MFNVVVHLGLDVVHLSLLGRRDLGGGADILVVVAECVGGLGFADVIGLGDFG